MTTERESALERIVALAESHGIAADEIAQHMAVAQTPERQGGIVKALLAYTGSIFIFAGLGLLGSMVWPDIGPLQRVVITLGPGMVAFVLGILAHRESRFAKAVTPLFLVAAFMQPAGLFVFLDEFVPRAGEPELAALIVFAILALQQGIAFAQLRQPSLLFLTMIFWFAFIGTTMVWLDVDGDVNSITVGLSALFLSHFAALRGNHAITPFWYFIGGGFLLGGVFAAVEGGPAEIAYLGVNGFLVYLSIRLASRAMLVISVFGLIGYLSYFTYEYFANIIGWPIAMIVMGLVMIGVSAYAFKLGQGMDAARR
ncbi:MAG: DUF2157 domain-containing protein [Alphaproteobacteria bacterium]|nr:DUF2157 domain-containing protein [Pseudomonadota bacterium]TDI68484.1 MAG: DUF2157 domain-containing protein [Alphaproteobacteria bacterium]